MVYLLNSVKNFKREAISHKLKQKQVKIISTFNKNKNKCSNSFKSIVIRDTILDPRFLKIIFFEIFISLFNI